MVLSPIVAMATLHLKETASAGPQCSGSRCSRRPALGRIATNEDHIAGLRCRCSGLRRGVSFAGDRFDSMHAAAPDSGLRKTALLRCVQWRFREDQCSDRAGFAPALFHAMRSIIDRSRSVIDRN
jgi:hypothetical protein